MSTRIFILKDGVITLAKTASDRQLALNSLVSTMTSNRVLRSNGTNIVLSQIDLSTDIITGVLPPANGGFSGSASYVDLTTNQNIGGTKTFSEGLILPTTVHTSVGAIWRNGANLEFRNNSNTTQIILNSAGNLSNLSDKQASLNNLVSNITTSGNYLRGNGTNIILSTIQVADVPTLNQNTTGTASNVTGVVLIANGGTGSSTQNFVDLTNAQTIAGAKTLTSSLTLRGDVGIMNLFGNTDNYNTFRFTANVNTASSYWDMGIGPSGLNRDFYISSGYAGGGLGFRINATNYNFTLSGAMIVTNTTAATSTTTGSGRFGGGIGVVGKGYFGGGLNLASLPTSSTGLTTGDVWRNGNVLNIV